MRSCRRTHSLAAICLTLCGCTCVEEPPPPDPTPEPPPSRPDDAFVPTFEDATLQSGLPTDEPPLRLVVLDIDRDGHLDIVFDGIRTFFGAGDGTFSEATEALFPDGPPSDLGVFGGFADPVDHTGSVFADVDNDGDLDFFFFKRADGVSYYWEPWVGTEAIDQIWLQDEGVFRPSLESLPDWTPLVGKPGATSMGAGWADYDGDGLIDLAVATAWSNTFCCDPEDWTVTDPSAESDPERLLQTETGNADMLFHNVGGGAFEDDTFALLESWWTGPYPYVLGVDTWGRLRSEATMAYGLAWNDFDDDGDPDLYISNYRLKANQLLRNDGGTFVEVAEEWDVDGEPDEFQTSTYYGHSTGAAWGDFDADGRMDLMVSNLSHPSGQVPFQDFSDHSYLLHREDGVFVDQAATRGLEWRHRTASPTWGDLDNDGRLDLVQAVVAINGEEPYHYTDLLLNRGDEFERINDAGLGERNDRSVIFADLDEDGLLDIVAGGQGTRNGLAILMNQGGENGRRNHFLAVSLQGNGTTSNRSAIGARLWVVQPDGEGREHVILREVTAGHGSGQQAPLRQHLGLGGSGDPVDLRIRWPDGSEQIVEDLQVDQHLEITQP